MVTQKMRILIKTIISNDLAYKYEYFKDKSLNLVLDSPFINYSSSYSFSFISCALRFYDVKSSYLDV